MLPAGSFVSGILDKVRLLYAHVPLLLRIYLKIYVRYAT